MRTFTLWIILILAGVPMLVQAAPDPENVSSRLVRVNAYDGNKLLSRATGLVVSNSGKVVTSAALIEDADRVTVVSVMSPAEITASISKVDEDRDVALLNVVGLSQPAFVFSDIDVSPGRRVFSIDAWVGQGNAARATEPRRFLQTEGTIGTVANLISDDRDRRSLGLVLQHNALTSVRALGGPLINECGEVVAVNRKNADVSSRDLRNSTDLQGTVLALSSKIVVEWLGQNGVTVARAEERCVSDDERIAQQAAAAEQQARMAAAEAEAAALRAEESEARAQELEQQASEAQQQTAAERQARDQARAEAEAARAEAAVKAEEAEQKALENSSLQTEVEQIREEREIALERVAAAEAAAAEAEAENRQRLMVIAGAAGGVFILALIAAFIMSRLRAKRMKEVEARASAAERDAANAKAQLTDLEADFPDCLIEGEDADGVRRAVKIPGRLVVAERAGVVLGRSAAHAACVIDHPEVSREHARFFLDGNELAIEDLDSTNGTTVNSHTLAPQESMTLRDGDNVQFGGLSLTVSFLR